jgi:hypothetical protein
MYVVYRKCVQCRASLFVRLCHASLIVQKLWILERVSCSFVLRFFVVCFMVHLSCLALRGDFVDRNWKKRSIVASVLANVFFVVCRA